MNAHRECVCVCLCAPCSVMCSIMKSKHTVSWPSDNASVCLWEHTRLHSSEYLSIPQHSVKCSFSYTVKSEPIKKLELAYGQTKHFMFSNLHYLVGSSCAIFIIHTTLRH